LDYSQYVLLINFTFSKPVGATSVVLQKSEDGGPWTNVDVLVPLDANSTTAAAPAIIGTPVKYRLAVVGGSMAGYSNEVNVTAELPLV